MTINRAVQNGTNNKLSLQIKNSVDKLSLDELLSLIEYLMQQVRRLIFTKTDDTGNVAPKRSTSVETLYQNPVSGIDEIRLDYDKLTALVLQLPVLERIDLLNRIGESLETEQSSPRITNIEDLAVETWSTEETNAFDEYLAESELSSQHSR
ncbi:hypothetical protein QUF64_15685 [Anaerolineales bacterium HSG6]|nr:hypothetical protein [Anaerolineales bacterium HSG6]